MLLIWCLCLNVFELVIISDGNIFEGASVCALFLCMPSIRRWAVIDC